MKISDFLIQFKFCKNDFQVQRAIVRERLHVCQGKNSKLLTAPHKPLKDLDGKGLWMDKPDYPLWVKVNEPKDSSGPWKVRFEATFSRDQKPRPWYQALWLKLIGKR